MSPGHSIGCKGANAHPVPHCWPEKSRSLPNRKNGGHARNRLQSHIDNLETHMNGYAMEHRLTRIENAITRLDAGIDSLDTRMNVGSEDLRQIKYDIAYRRGMVKTFLSNSSKTLLV